MNFNLDYQDLFDSLGLSDLSEQEKEKRFQEMQEIIEKEVFLRISDLLSEEEQMELEKIEDDEKYFEFFEKNKIDLATITREVAQKYREDLLADMAYFEGKLNN